jgi:hypothetical protein
MSSWQQFLSTAQDVSGLINISANTKPLRLYFEVEMTGGAQRRYGLMRLRRSPDRLEMRGISGIDYTTLEHPFIDGISDNP